MNIGWIDFSKEQRNKVMSVINLLSEPEAVDELGVGIIRDAFSDIFFPGTSTIQTRAKYFLITPYLLAELEREKGMTPDKMINRLHEQELDFIDILKQSGENGIIGETAGRKLKRKPSDIYWNGIRTFGIFTGGKMSLYDYARITCLLKNKKHNTKVLRSIGLKDDEKDADDIDAVTGELTGGFWKLPDFSADWRDGLTIKLTKQEAEFLRNQIMSSVPDSILYFVLEKNYTDFLQFESFDDIEGMVNLFPHNLKEDYIMAKEFSDFVFGIHLRYNMLLSQGKNDDVITEWKLWSLDMGKCVNIDMQKILFDRLRIKNGKLIKFLFDCKDAMLKNDIEKLDELVIMRERRLKGDKRAKLYNVNEFEYKGWVGIGKLQYRFRNAKNLLRDIFEGIGDVNA
ncbi:MAG: hypothetical protein GX286_00835 [Clostridiales bacterium]|nr:hypothetical protein [Clostridiales bacterium]